MSSLHTDRAFRRGFYAGFSAPLTVFFGRRRISYHHTLTDAQAWRDVGRLLNEAYIETGKDIGKPIGPAISRQSA